AGFARILPLAAFYLSVSSRRAVSPSVQYARRLDVRLRSRAALGQQFFSALLLYHRHRRRHSKYAVRAQSDGPKHRRFGRRLRNSPGLRPDLSEPHRLFLFSFPDQDETFRLDHRRHRALFLDYRGSERHCPPSPSWRHGIRLSLSARWQSV